MSVSSASRLAALFAALVTAAWLAACGPAAPAAPASQPAAPAAPAARPAERVKVPVGLAVQTYSFAPLYVAKEKGFWEEQGLDVELNIFKSGTDLRQALLADSVMVGSGGLNDSITFATQGAEVPAFLFYQNALVFKLFAKPEIRTLDDLRGRSVAVSGLGTLGEQVVRIGLHRAGKDPTMVQYQPAGGPPQRLAALQAGAVDSAVLDPPLTQLAQQGGYAMLIDFAKEIPGYPANVGYARKNALQEKRDVFVRFARGYIQGAEHVYDPRNEEEVVEFAAKYLDMKKEDSRLAYQDTVGYFSRDGMPTREGAEMVLESLRQFGSVQGVERVTPEQIIYPEIVDEAKRR